MRVVGKSSSSSMGIIVFASWFPNLACMDSNAGLGAREALVPGSGRAKELPAWFFSSLPCMDSRAGLGEREAERLWIGSVNKLSCCLSTRPCMDSRAGLGERDAERLASGTVKVSDFSSANRACIDSIAGLADREMSLCGTASPRPGAWDSAAKKVPAFSSSIESRLRGRFCLKPSSLETISILLKYCLGVSIWVVAVNHIPYLDGFDLQLQGGILINDDQWMWMQLEAGQSPHVVDTIFNTLLKRRGFVGACDDDNHFPGLFIVRHVLRIA